MRNLLLFIALAISGNLLSQTPSGAMPMDSINGMTIPTCNGLFSDSGGHFTHC